MKNFARRKNDGGASLTEFTIVLPFLILLLFGFIQFGLIFAAHLTVRNAANVAVRYASLGDGVPPTPEAVLNVAGDAVEPLLDRNRLSGSFIADHPLPGSLYDVKYLSLDYDMPLLLAFVVPGATDGKIAISASAYMR